MKRNSDHSPHRIYLDYAASTPIDKEALHAMEPYFSLRYGNPGSLHSFGQEAIAAVDDSREIIAKTINADFREIIFTGSATEANNLTLRGVVRNFWRTEFIPHIITTAIEHESILETARDMEKRGAAEFTILPVDRNGVVDLEKLKSALNKRTVLVSIMYANNEIGTVQPIAEIAKVIRAFRVERSAFSNAKTLYPLLSTLYPLFHTDAVQAFQYLDCDVQKLGVDLMTLSAHKIYGPKGVGLLYAGYRVQGTGYSETEKLTPRASPLHPIITGGGQEFGIRSGTENVPAIVGFAKAVELAISNKQQATRKITELRNYFWKELYEIYPLIEVNGVNRQNYFLQPVSLRPATGLACSSAADRREELRSLETTDHARLPAQVSENNSVGFQYLPNILNVYFPKNSSQDLLIKLDRVGIAVSSGAACSARSSKLSHVLQALGLPPKRIQESLRFSFGKYTTKEELKKVLSIMKYILHQ